MLTEKIDQLIEFNILKEDLRKLGINFITAGIVGVFVNHFVGPSFHGMLETSALITTIGGALLFLGLKRGKK